LHLARGVGGKHGQRRRFTQGPKPGFAGMKGMGDASALQCFGRGHAQLGQYGTLALGKLARLLVNHAQGADAGAV